MEGAVHRALPQGVASLVVACQGGTLGAACRAVACQGGILAAGHLLEASAQVVENPRALQVALASQDEEQAPLAFLAHLLEAPP